MSSLEDKNNLYQTLLKLSQFLAHFLASTFQTRVEIIEPIGDKRVELEPILYGVINPSKDDVFVLVGFATD